jgi:hypothetical protein
VLPGDRVAQAPGAPQQAQHKALDGNANGRGDVATSKFSALQMSASERNAASILDAAAAVEHQEARNREAQPTPPREYSGLAGLQSELDGAANRVAPQ